MVGLTDKQVKVEYHCASAEASNIRIIINFINPLRLLFTWQEDEQETNRNKPIVQLGHFGPFRSSSSLLSLRKAFNEPNPEEGPFDSKERCEIGG